MTIVSLFVTYQLPANYGNDTATRRQRQASWLEDCRDIDKRIIGQMPYYI